MNLPKAYLQNLQNYTQSSTGFTGSLSYQLHHSFKRVGITYSSRPLLPGRGQQRLENIVHRPGISWNQRP